MDKIDIPDFGDVVGLTRLYRQAVERIRRSDMTEEEQAAIIGMIEEEYRAARAAKLGALLAQSVTKMDTSSNSRQ
jgi:hypothetical protein